MRKLVVSVQNESATSFGNESESGAEIHPTNGINVPWRGSANRCC